MGKGVVPPPYEVEEVYSDEVTHALTRYLWQWTTFHKAAAAGLRLAGGVHTQLPAADDVEGDGGPGLGTCLRRGPELGPCRDGSKRWLQGGRQEG